MPNRTGAESISCVLQKLGPFPMQTLDTFEDLGLNDDEICAYFAISTTDLARVRQIERVMPHDADQDVAVPRFPGLAASRAKPLFGSFLAARASC